MSNTDTIRHAPASGRLKYADHKVILAPDATKGVWYEPRPPFDVLKVHYRMCRVPSEKRILVRHLTGATPADRAYTESILEQIPAFFEVIELGANASVRRHRTATGKYHVTAHAGSLIDDPLAHLELEMMSVGDPSIAL